MVFVVKRGRPELEALQAVSRVDRRHPPRVKFHSLRHNVETRSATSTYEEVRDAIQGHGENGVSREYGSGYYLRTLNKAVQMIRYDGCCCRRDVEVRFYTVSDIDAP